jgi:hypothetical protein
LRHSGDPGRQPMVARVEHGMIQPGDRSRRGPQMSATRNGTLNDPNSETLYDRRKRMLLARLIGKLGERPGNAGFWMH